MWGGGWVGGGGGWVSRGGVESGWVGGGRPGSGRIQARLRRMGASLTLPRRHRGLHPCLLPSTPCPCRPANYRSVAGIFSGARLGIAGLLPLLWQPGSQGATTTGFPARPAAAAPCHTPTAQNPTPPPLPRLCCAGICGCGVGPHRHGVLRLPPGARRAPAAGQPPGCCGAAARHRPGPAV